MENNFSGGFNILQFSKRAKENEKAVSISPELQFEKLRVLPLAPGTMQRSQMIGHEAELQDLNAQANSAYMHGYYFFLEAPVLKISSWEVIDGVLYLDIDWEPKFCVVPLDDSKIKMLDSDGKPIE